MDFEKLIYTYRVPLALTLLGLILVASGIFYLQKSTNPSSHGIEVLEATKEAEEASLNFVVEIAGAVEAPGVYQLPKDSRVEDLLIASGGLSKEADRDWVEKNINRAAILIDGQKVYILRVGERSNEATANSFGGYQSGSSVLSGNYAGKVNINTASQKELEGLWGIGPVYAQNIIEGRPYSKIEELLSRGIIKKNVYERNKDLLTVN